jgi:predicted HTH domain antitoxin
MKTIAPEVPDDLVWLNGGSDEELARDLRLAAAIQWYSQGIVSQGRAAEIAGLNRTSFLLELGKAKVDAFQITEAELKEELEPGLEARRQRLTADASHIDLMSTEVQYPHLTFDEDGTARVERTRYKVVHLAGEHYYYGWSAEEILRQHPDLRLE